MFQTVHMWHLDLNCRLMSLLYSSVWQCRRSICAIIKTPARKKGLLTKTAQCTHCDKGFSMIGSLDFFKPARFHVEPNKNCIIWQRWEEEKRIWYWFTFYTEYLIKVSITNGCSVVYGLLIHWIFLKIRISSVEISLS